MTQNQVELPPISIARYLELLKRRRWQVVPMTLVGLLVGVIAAFMIPRYYVASTTAIYRGSMLDQDSRTQADPLFAEVNNAELSIPAKVPDALEALEWIGADTSDPERDAEIEAVTGRLDVGAYQDDDRGYTNITIDYKDTDGERAANFANTLRTTWIEGIKARVLEGALGELDRISKTVTDRGTAVQSARREMMIHARQHGIDPRDQSGQAGAEKWLHDQVREEVSLEDELTKRVRELKKQVSWFTKSLENGSIPRYVEVPVALEDNPELRKVLLPLMDRRQYLRFALSNAEAGHPEYNFWRAELVQVEKHISDLGPKVDASGDLKERKDNPLWLKNQKWLDKASTDLEEAEFKLEIATTRKELLQAELKAMPEIYEVYDDLRWKLASLEAQYSSAQEAQSALNDKYKKARSGNPFDTVFQATVPPAPTEPNLTLVVLTGGLFGLGAAIGLVLLLDFLRSTFKTVDDVQFALAVPVLGVMAHLETDEERLRVGRQRRRLSIAAATFLVLSLSLVTVYYLDPARLPPVVLRAMDLLLGSTR